MTIVILLTGFALLIGGGELLVRGAVRLAALAGVSRLVIGLTVVAMGTSMPEMVVSVGAALQGRPDLAVGNVVGSNIFNVLFILGLSALIIPLTIHSQLIRFDVPVLTGVSLGLFGLAADGFLSRFEGVLLIAALVAYTAGAIWLGQREGAVSPPDGQAADRSLTTLLMQVGLVAAGLALLVIGSRLTINGATDLAHSMGVSELVIGLTIVAVGTSLPEVAASVTAALRGQRDVAVGNVVGSNILNILGILGVSAAVSPSAMPVSAGLLSFDLIVMTATAIACLPVFFTGRSIARWEGALFLVYYLAYTLYLAMEAADHPLMHTYHNALQWFALPLTAVTLVVVLVRDPTRILARRIRPG